MNPEAEQPVPAAPDQDGPTAGGAAVANPAAAGAKAVSRRRAGVPVWRTGKPDAFLAAAVDTARTAIEGITPAATIGQHLAAKSEGDRLVTHLFESRLPGYLGWQWYAVLTRNSRSKVVTVNELGLLPSEDSILAPEWVPWAERVRPEDEQEPEQTREPAQAQEHEQGQEPVQAQEPEQGQVPGGGEPDDDGQPDDDART
ncbi:DUF3027 domain-containing protein [Arthrobacter sp. BB-1]|uniref:DUF3027 domain-containing protein n=1 Tax=unclassified Arthrobacter TaxID=235627 RepID=UPI0010DD9DCD|nr:MULTISPECIES: DUF3027 domain-containing protein [unclassified Arthrobacter]TNB74892.1 DUF3027 domain-containing protein [Arthrobacter sp. BB-1]VII99161.1 hypothetical protein [Arthrobacter sp. DR-2P]